MKDCKKIHPLLSLYIEGQLSSPERNQVEKHLGVCVTARKELEHFRHLLDGLTHTPEPQAPADLHAKIMARLGAPVKLLTLRHAFWGLPAWTLAAAAIVVFFLLNQSTNWRDTLRMQKPAPARDEITAGASAPSGGLVNIPAAKKKEKVEFGSLGNARSKNSPAGNEMADALQNKDADLRKSEDKKMEGAANFAPAQPLAERAMAKSAPRGNTATQAEAPVAAAPSAAGAPAAAPAVSAALPPSETMDQSLKSLTYSKEQSVLSWSGNNGPATLEQQTLIADADSFQKQWQVFYKTLPVPTVDFTAQAVVYLTAGEEPTAGYSISLSRLEEKTDQLVIHYRVETPPAGAVTAQILTHPWAMQVIPKPSKPVVFQKD